MQYNRQFRDGNAKTATQMQCSPDVMGQTQRVSIGSREFYRVHCKILFERNITPKTV